MNEAKQRKRSQGLGQARASNCVSCRTVVDGTKILEDPETPAKRWRATYVASLKIGNFRDRVFCNSQRSQRLPRPSTFGLLRILFVTCTMHNYTGLVPNHIYTYPFSFGRANPISTPADPDGIVPHTVSPGCPVPSTQRFLLEINGRLINPF